MYSNALEALLDSSECACHVQLGQRASFRRKRGEYVRRYMPELTHMLIDYIFKMDKQANGPPDRKLFPSAMDTCSIRGVAVTYVTPIPIASTAPNLRQIDVSSNFEHFKFGESLNIRKVLEKEVNIAGVDVFYKGMHDIAGIALKHEKVQKLFLDTNEEFDVAVVQWLYTDLYAGVHAVFNCPMIWSSTMEPHPMVLRLIDEFPNPAYIPDHRSPIYPPFTFSERVGELWNTLKIMKIRWNLADEERTVYKEAYTPAFQKRGRELPCIDEVKYNASLMFGNSHVSSGMSMKLPQNYIQISGYHIKTDTPALPENLQKIMDNAPEGVIYFSLGSMMKAKTMPPELKSGFLEMFRKLEQVVIWKIEEQQPNVPKNVHIVEWAPQQSILAHPNTVLFITHGGLLSSTETIHFGVPVIGIPLFADQFLNIKRAVTRGFGKHVPLGYDTPVKLKEAIDDILGNPKYAERIKQLSLVYHDRPVSPGQEIVHWVEHVVKTRGAPHLRSVALLVPWYQKLYLDLLALIVLSVFVIFQLFKRLLLPVVSKYVVEVVKSVGKSPKKND